MYKVRWKFDNCSGLFAKVFEEYEDAEHFAQIWLLDAVLRSEDDSSAFDYTIIDFTKTGEKNDG